MDFDRFKDFKPKFRKRLEQEFNEPFHKRKASAEGNSSGQDVSTEDQELHGTPTTTSSKVSTASENGGQISRNSIRLETQTDSGRPSKCSTLTNDTGLIEALCAANNLMKKFYATACSINADGLSPKSFQPGELTSLYNDTKKNAYRIITEAAKGDQQVLQKLLSYFDSANFCNLQKLSIERRQLEAVAITIEKLVRDGCKRALRNYIDDSSEGSTSCNGYVNDQQEKLTVPDSKEELELIRSFGVQWEPYYLKLKADYAEQLELSIKQVMHYQKHMDGFLKSALCVDIGDFDRAHAEAVATLPESSEKEFNHNVSSFLEDLRLLFQKQVLLNKMREEISVCRAVDYACDKFIDIFGSTSKEHADMDLEHLHSSVFKTIRKCFDTVENFEYTKMWRMPQTEPERAKEVVRMAQELKKLKRVVSIKEKAASLLRQLEPEHRQEFFREALAFDDNQGDSTEARTEDWQIETSDFSDHENNNEEPQRKKTK